MNPTIFGTVLVAVLLSLALIIYFVPTLLGWGRHHPHTVWLLVLNMLLGFTGVGWVAALTWALWGSGRSGDVAQGVLVRDVISGLLLLVVCPPVFVFLIVMAITVVAF